jgi:hypothetical protein
MADLRDGFFHLGGLSSTALVEPGQEASNCSFGSIASGPRHNVEFDGKLACCRNYSKAVGRALNLSVGAGGHIPQRELPHCISYKILHILVLDELSNKCRACCAVASSGRFFDAVGKLLCAPPIAYAIEHAKPAASIGWNIHKSDSLAGSGSLSVLAQLVGKPYFARAQHHSAPRQRRAKRASSRSTSFAVSGGELVSSRCCLPSVNNAELVQNKESVGVDGRRGFERIRCRAPRPDKARTSATAVY